jgi:hypothetical protein
MSFIQYMVVPEHFIHQQGGSKHTGAQGIDEHIVACARVDHVIILLPESGQGNNGYTSGKW